MWEKIVETKVCKHCKNTFTITDKDLELYDKLSPSFPVLLWEGGGTLQGGGFKKYQIPTPTLCPDCRQQRRLAWRNERKLYRRTCDASGKQIISIYSPDKPYKVYDQKIWRSDSRDPMEYGQDYDFSQWFFQQFAEILQRIPLFSLSIFNSEDCDYTSATDSCKSCYMSFNIMQSHDLYYSAAAYATNNSCDVDYSPEKGDTMYQCVDVVNCYNSKYLLYCNDCSNSAFLYNCNGCSDCIMCYNLNNKQYYIENIAYTPQEYQQKKEEIKQRYTQTFFLEFITSAIRKDCNIINSENVTGNNIFNSQNIVHGFSVYSSQNCRYCQNIIALQDSADCIESWLDAYGLYECHGASGVKNAISANNGYYNTRAYYVHNCFYSSDIFGCVGLRNKQYCIFNKQYTKEEYEKLVPKIIEHMQKNGERWEFFPAHISPFGYNETIAMEYFPLSKDEAMRRWYKRMDQEYPINIPENAQMINAKDLPTNIQEVTDDILNKVIVCEETGKPFRIIKPELEFYRKHNLSIPHKHPDVRHIERIHLRHPRKLFERICAKCWVVIQTTYAPERPEIVYCEACYNKNIYW